MPVEPSRKRIDVEAVQRYNGFTEEEVSIIIEILSIFDNRHDFKEGTRNKSLTINEVLQLLKRKSNVIRRHILEIVNEEKQETFTQLLDIHCKDVVRHTQNNCETATNPDKIVEAYIFQEIFKEPLISEREYAKLDVSMNGKLLGLRNKKLVTELCGCKIEDDKVSAVTGKRNRLLDRLLKIFADIMKVDSDEIRFCIDVSSIGEWVFRHDGLENPPKTHLKTIADEYDHFYTHPDTEELPRIINLTRNHIILKNFSLKPDGIFWRSSVGNATQINLEGVPRGGVTLMTYAIRAVLDRDTNRAVRMIEDIFGLSRTLSPNTYGQHIMDFKRLMDMSKLAVTRLYNLINKPVILVTHDHILYLLAKMYKCPVILTFKDAILVDIPPRRLPVQVSGGTLPKNTEFLEEFERTILSNENVPSVADSAFDLLYKFIDKNIERYYSQPLHIQDQHMQEAYQEEKSTKDFSTFKKEREALFQTYLNPPPKRRPRSTSSKTKSPLQLQATKIPRGSTPPEVFMPEP